MAKSDISSFNKLVFRRLALASEYATLSLEMESLMSSTRISISRAKSLYGYSLSNASLLDDREMEPQVGIDIDGDTFSLVELGQHAETEESEAHVRKRGTKESQKKSDEKEKNKEDDEDETEGKNTRKPSFRPFGVLEPQPAKQARRTIASALSLVCDLANLRTKILKIDEELESVKTALLKDTQHCETLMSLLKV